MDHSPKNCGESSFLFTLIFFFFSIFALRRGLKCFVNILTPSYSLGWKRRRTLLLLWRGRVFACKYGGWTDGRNMGPARSAIKAAVYKSGSSSPMQIYWTGGSLLLVDWLWIVKERGIINITKWVISAFRRQRQCPLYTRSAAIPRMQPAKICLGSVDSEMKIWSDCLFCYTNIAPLEKVREKKKRNGGAIWGRLIGRISGHRLLGYG